MSLGLWNLQWLNHNSQRSYPIADWASKKCNKSESIQIPDDFILAINFSVSCGVNVNIDEFYIKAISITSTGASIYLANSAYSDTVAVTHIDADKTKEVVTAALVGLNDFDDTVGYIAINPNSSIFNLNAGYYTFNYSATALESDCIRPMLRGVSSIRVKTGGGYSEKLYGDIVLVAGSNISIDVTSSSLTTSTIRISAVKNSEYSTSCTDIDNAERQSIKTINGVSPSSSGDISIVGAKCVSATTGINSITLTDTCAEPCCGCPELNALEEQIERLMDGRATLEQFISDLVSGVTALEIQVLGS